MSFIEKLSRSVGQAILARRMRSSAGMVRRGAQTSFGILEYGQLTVRRSTYRWNLRIEVSRWDYTKSEER